jgi:chromosome segregation ATPase
MSKVYDQYRVNEEGDSWYLKISDGSVYGPETYAVMSRWVAEGRVTPDDQVSQDGESWMPAAGVTRFKMEWIAEFSDGSTYGPFNLLAVPNLLKTATFGPTTKLVNRVSGKSLRVDQVVKPGGQTSTPAVPASQELARAAVSDRPTSKPQSNPAAAVAPVAIAMEPVVPGPIPAPQQHASATEPDSVVSTGMGAADGLKSSEAMASIERERKEWERKLRILESQNVKLTKTIADKDEQSEAQAAWMIELREKNESKIKDLQEALDKEKALRVTLADKQGGVAAEKMGELTRKIEELGKKQAEAEKRLLQEQDLVTKLKKQSSETEKKLQETLVKLTGELASAKLEATKLAATMPVSSGPTSSQLTELTDAKIRIGNLEKELASKTGLLADAEGKLEPINRKYIDACNRADEAERVMRAFAENQQFSVKEAVDEALKVQALHYSDLNTLVEEKGKSLQVAEVRIAELISELDSIRALSTQASSRCEQHQQALKANEARHAEALVEVDTLRRVVAESDSRSELLQQALKASELQLTQKMAELEDLRATVADTSSRCDSHQAMLKSKEAEYAGQISNYKASATEALARVEILESSLATALQTMVQRDNEIEKATRERQQLMDKLSVIGDELTGLREAQAPLVAQLAARSRDVEQFAADRAAMELDLKTLRGVIQQVEEQQALRVGSLESSIQDRDVIVARLTAENVREREWHTSAESSRLQMESGFRAELESLQTELQSQLAVHQVTVLELEHARVRLGNMEKQLLEQSANWSRQIDHLRTEVALHEAHVKDLASELAMGRGLLADVRRDKEEREQSLVHRIRELEDRERTSTTFLENATGEIRLIRARFIALETDHQQLMDRESARELSLRVIKAKPEQALVASSIDDVQSKLALDVSNSVDTQIPYKVEKIPLVNVVPITSVPAGPIQVAPGVEIKPAVLPVAVVVETVEVDASNPSLAVTPAEYIADAVPVPLISSSDSPMPVIDGSLTEAKFDTKNVPAEVSPEPVLVAPEWYLMLDDDSIYGPVSEQDLKEWARQCRIDPKHKVSRDQKMWRLAGALSQLEMDWLVVTHTGEQLGPFHRSAISDLLADGGIEPTDRIHHRDGGQETSAAEFCKTSDIKQA